MHIILIYSIYSTQYWKIVVYWLQHFKTTLSTGLRLIIERDLDLAAPAGLIEATSAIITNCQDFGMDLEQLLSNATSVYLLAGILCFLSTLYMWYR